MEITDATYTEGRFSMPTQADLRAWHLCVQQGLDAFTLRTTGDVSALAGTRASAVVRDRIVVDAVGSTFPGTTAWRPPS